MRGRYFYRPRHNHKTFAYFQLCFGGLPALFFLISTGSMPIFWEASLMAYRRKSANFSSSIIPALRISGISVLNTKSRYSFVAVTAGNTVRSHSTLFPKSLILLVL